MGDISWSSDYYYQVYQSSGWKLCQTSPPPGSWTVTGSGCTKVGDCIQSNNHPGSYGNNEACTIDANNVEFTVDAFSTESGYDFLTVGGVQYSGSSGPASGSYSGTISWSSDYSVVNSGWKLCRA